MFELLHQRVKQGLKELGFSTPTSIQAEAIPEVLKGRHSLLIAPTGIGKTEAALLPIFSRFLEAGGSEGINILYVTPLRALNRDLMYRLKWWGEKLGISISVRHGDTSQGERRKQALSPPEMLITTPETLQAILTGKVMRRHLKGLDYVVVDEIHELAESKRGAQLASGLERLYAIAQKDFQRIGISATLGNPHDIASFLAWEREVKVIKAAHPRELELSVEYPMPQKEDREMAGEIYSSISAASRVRRMGELIEKYSQVLIFVNTRETAEALASRFRMMGKEVGIHHSSLSQEVRIETEEKFKKGELKALIATSSLELGIDIGNVELIVQYKSPRQVSRLVQRVGRSGHAMEKVSRGITFATDSDDIMESMVITRRAKEEKVENIEPWEKPFDVLAHQLVGLAFEYRRVKKRHAYLLLRQSYPFRNLTLEELEEVLELLHRIGLLWVEEENFGMRKRSLLYYYQNLSTIPDEKKFRVTNFATGTRVGVLDEKFVASYAEQGQNIIFKGSPWKVLSVEEGEVTVEPLDEVGGAVPSWVGEEIPVPFEVAQEVARLREKAWERDLESLRSMPASGYTKRMAVSKIRHHRRKDIPLGGEKELVVEHLNSFAVIHSPFGHKVNQALGRLYSLVLTSLTGASVAFRGDAYRVILEAPVPLKKEDLGELFNLSPSVVRNLLESNLKRTSLFRWKFSQVARRFGVISKDFSYTDARRMGSVIKAYEGTVVYRETLKEIFKDNMDVGRMEEVVEGIASEEVEVKILGVKEPSPIAEMGFRQYGEVVVPERAEKLIANAVRKRIARRRVELFCLYCGKWHESFKIRSMPADIRCGNCSARMLAVLKGRDNREQRKLYRRFKGGEELSREEKREVRRMQTSGNLFLSYGKKSAIAQAARGIGPQVAKRTLARAKDEDTLYREIVKEERNYARTRVFWD